MIAESGVVLVRWCNTAEGHCGSPGIRWPHAAGRHDARSGGQSTTAEMRVTAVDPDADERRKALRAAVLASLRAGS